MLTFDEKQFTKFEFNGVKKFNARVFDKDMEFAVPYTIVSEDGKIVICTGNNGYLEREITEQELKDILSGKDDVLHDAVFDACFVMIRSEMHSYIPEMLKL